MDTRITGASLGRARVLAPKVRGPSAPVPAQRVLALQTAAGNRAVVRMLHRRPVVSQRAEDALDDYETLWKDVAAANQVSATVWRREFLARVTQGIAQDMERLAAAVSAGRSPAEAGLDMDAIERRLDAFGEELWTETQSSKLVWEELQGEVAAERERLTLQADFAAIEALKELDREYARTKRVADRLGANLVTEDLLGLDDMLSRDRHVRIGQARGAREEERAEADLAAVEDEDREDARDLDDDDSVLKTAWQVFGWDSVGEFAGDVALTVLTAGIGKLFKIGAKGARAARRAERARELRKLLKARRAARAKRRLDRAHAMLKLVRGDARDALAGQAKWMRDNWGKVARKFGTDVAAMAGQGSVANLGSTAARRAGKEFLNARVMEFFGRDDKYERRLLRLGWAAQLKGRDERARKLIHMYLLLNVRRRLLVNALYYGAIDSGTLRMPDAATLRRIGISTAGEVVQDLVLAIPFLDKPVVKDAVEAARKWIVKEAEAVVR